jgi:hypothetical protein
VVAAVLLFLVAVGGSVAGVFVGSPLVGLAINQAGRAGILPRRLWHDDVGHDDETLQMQVHVAGGQLLAVGTAVALHAGGVVALAGAVAAAATAWYLTPLTRAFNNLFLVLVPTALTGALAAVLASLI